MVCILTFTRSEAQPPKQIETRENLAMIIARQEVRTRTEASDLVQSYS